MVDDNTVPELDLGTGFEKIETERIAEPGSDILRQKQKTVDPATGRIEIEKMGNPCCDCGIPRSLAPDVFRCHHCSNTACGKCIVPIGSRQYCPGCVESAFSLNKQVFVTLLYIAKSELAPDDLTSIQTVGNESVEITIDSSLNTLIDNDYVNDTGELTRIGQTALAAGDELYGDDNDVESLKHTFRVQEVANRGS